MTPAAGVREALLIFVQCVFFHLVAFAVFSFFFICIFIYTIFLLYCFPNSVSLFLVSQFVIVLCNVVCGLSFLGGAEKLAPPKYK